MVGIAQLAFNGVILACAVVFALCWRNQVKINSNTIAMVSLLNQRVDKLEIAEKPRKKG